MKNFTLTTERLKLRCFTLEDAPVVFELLNEPTFTEFIGDKGIHTIAEARDYLQDGPLKCYQENGYGVYLALTRSDGRPAGMCGLFKRGNLEQPDLGFAFFSHSLGKGLAFESSRVVIDHARDVLRLPMISAVADPENGKSITLIERLGFRYKHIYRMPNETKDLNYYEIYFGENE